MAFLIALNNFLNRFVMAFGLRRFQHFWGSVYDSQTKQPLDPAIVKLVHVSSGRTVATCITDLNGRYGFLADTGKYKLVAQKTHYTFPSKKILGNSDGFFSNIYHGEFIEVGTEPTVLSFNIPMDPVDFDWNQKAKQNLVKIYPLIELFFSKVLPLLFWTFLFVVIFLVFTHPNVKYFWMFGVCVFVLALAFILPPMRLWGRIYFNDTKKAGAGLILELSPKNIENIVLFKTETTYEGKFFLRGSKGSYILKIKKPMANGQDILLKKMTIRLGNSGYFNAEIQI